jgi:hypothetical protein
MDSISPKINFTVALTRKMMAVLRVSNLVEARVETCVFCDECE